MLVGAGTIGMPWVTLIIVEADKFKLLLVVDVVEDCLRGSVAGRGELVVIFVHVGRTVDPMSSVMEGIAVPESSCLSPKFSTLRYWP